MNIPIHITIVNFFAYLFLMIKHAFGFSFESNSSNEDKETSSEGNGSCGSSCGSACEPNVMYFDFETTGLNPFHDKIIEFCFLNDTSRLMDEMDTITMNPIESVFEDEHYLSSLVNPKRKFDEKITTITGIHPYDLINKPSIDELASIIINFLDNGKINFMVAHNCHSFDEIILKKMLNEAGAKHLISNMRFVDTLLLARKLMPELNRYSQKVLCEYFKIKTKSHRADEDCKALRGIYHKLLGIYIKRVSSDYPIEVLIENPEIIYDFLYN
jgi:DNA polymerase III epsilon subunit-like protein